MLGAIAGDIIGSVYEHHNIKTTEFPLFSSNSRFTDDTVMTLAIADSLMNGEDWGSKLKEYFLIYPNAGYGRSFKGWCWAKQGEPYRSWGNGSAMRVSAIGFAGESLEQVLTKAKESAEITHNHPEGIKGAQATAAAIFLARTGADKATIKQYIETDFSYELSDSIANIRKDYSFDVSCQGSVPQAIIAFLESTDFESAIRLSISIGGDSDTIACICGGIAEAFYGGVPEEIEQQIITRLNPHLSSVLSAFEQYKQQNIDSTYEYKTNDCYIGKRGSFDLLTADKEVKVDELMLSRAQGCLLGQLCGDALGGQVEFKTADQIKKQYPQGVLDLKDGGTWNTLAGQPTDDSEMALMLARMLIRDKSYQSPEALLVYKEWLNSEPFDMGNTIKSGLNGYYIKESQANGALMRISPLAIFGANFSKEMVANWAMEDAKLTHSNLVCLQINALYTMAISETIKQGLTAEQVYKRIVDWANEMHVEQCIHDQIIAAKDSPPEDFLTNQGWVLIAFRNTLYQLLHAESAEQGIINTVNKGGDTDTNAAICGALLGAVYGRRSIPDRWVKKILCCRPKEGLANVLRPRPQCYWPVDALIIAERLLQAGQS